MKTNNETDRDGCPPDDQSQHPTFDADGYPTEETELAIKAWDFRDVPGWLAYIREAWNHHYGRMWVEGGMLKMATGGWSGNESITRAMRENYVLWALLWESSHRGGIEVLRMPNAEVSDGSGKRNVANDEAYRIMQAERCRAVPQEEIERRMREQVRMMLNAYRPVLPEEPPKAPPSAWARICRWLGI